MGEKVYEPFKEQMIKCFGLINEPFDSDETSYGTFEVAINGLDNEFNNRILDFIKFTKD